MTVFSNPQVIAKWGTPLPEVGRAAVDIYKTPFFKNQWGEIHFTVTPERPMLPAEYDASIAYFTHRWAIEHPEFELKYIEVTRGSADHLKIQFISHAGSPPFWAALAGFLLAAFTIACMHAVKIAVAILVVAIGYALYKRLQPPDFICPICGMKFGRYEDLVAHMNAMHPNQPIPPPPPPVPLWDYLKWGVIIIVGAVVFRYVIYPMVVKKK